MEYLENHGNQIEQFLFTHGLKNDRLLSAITVGYFISPPTHLCLPIVIVFIRLSDLPDSSLALWRKQLLQIVLYVMSKNVFCKCTKIFFYPLCVCVCVQRGCCPNLVFLEINTMLDSKDCELPVYIQALQMACPKLKVNM